VRQAIDCLLSLPVSRDLKWLGEHYRALLDWQQGEITSAERTFERLIDKGPAQYVARAYQGLAAIYKDNKQDLDAASSLYAIAGRYSIKHQDLLGAVESIRDVAALRGINGDHRRALSDLQEFLPLAASVRAHHPAQFYEYLNSVAVERGETGRVKEAIHLSELTLATPYANRYGHWLETRLELQEKLDWTPVLVSPAIEARPMEFGSAQEEVKVEVVEPRQTPVEVARPADVNVPSSPDSSIKLLFYTLLIHAALHRQYIRAAELARARNVAARNALINSCQRSRSALRAFFLARFHGRAFLNPWPIAPLAASARLQTLWEGAATCILRRLAHAIHARRSIPR
jgi:hypothetical protein